MGERLLVRMQGKPSLAVGGNIPDLRSASGGAKVDFSNCSLALVVFLLWFTEV